MDSPPDLILQVFQLFGLGFGVGFATIAWIWTVAVALLCLLMAFAVHADAHGVRVCNGLFLFPPIIWALIVLVFNLPGLAVYWAIHHSTLRSPLPPEAR